MEPSEAKSGMRVAEIKGDRWGWLDQAPNGWDVTMENGSRLQSVDLSNWVPAPIKPESRKKESDRTSRHFDN